MSSNQPPEPAGPGKPPALVPRDAASLVVLDKVNGRTFVLLGKRRSTQRFAPGKYVFPGGSVDEADWDEGLAGDLPASERGPLAHDIKRYSGRVPPHAFALAAVRETFEEAGLLIGEPSPSLPEAPSPAWALLLSHGLRPRLAGLRFIARAITPPGRTRRFDARFFTAPASEIALRSESSDGEFLELVWSSFAEARERDLHGMTREILDELEQQLGDGLVPMVDAPIPYFFQAGGRWQRRLIPRR